MTGIYKITNQITNNFYIGKSNDIKRRWMEHKSIKPKGNDRLHSDMKKYGLENFKFEVVEECEEAILLERERYYIHSLLPYYNTVGKGVPQEVREKISISLKEWWKELPEETKRKIIDNNLKRPAVGHEVSEETREKLRQKNLGKKQTRETIEKRKQTFIDKKKNGYVQTNAGHKKKIVCIETGEIFESVKDAGEKMNVSASSISHHLKGRQKTAKGFHFEYLKV